MPVKPSITVDVRASQAVYTTGPVGLIGKATKIQRAAADVTEGHKVDSPLGTFPVDAQNENYGDNVVDQYALWTSLGTNVADFDAHIVETNETGDIAVRGVTCDDIAVNTNGTADGVVITANSGSKGILINRTAGASDQAIQITSPDTATGDVMTIDADGSSIALRLRGQENAALVITMTDNGGVIGPAIHLNTTLAIPTGGVTDGDIWLQQQSGRNNLRAGMGTTDGYFRLAKHSPCYARSADISGFLISGSATEQLINAFSFPSDMQPADSGRVKVTIWGQIQMQSDQTNNITLIVRDTTAGGDPTICQIEIQSPDTGVVSEFEMSTTYAQTYLLPGGGARSFDLVWSGTNGSASSIFKGWVEIEEIPGD